MKIDLTTLLNGRESKRSFSDVILPDPQDDTMAMMPNGIKVEKPIQVSGTVENNHSYMSLDALVTVDYTTQCDRCLAEVNKTMEIPFQRIVSLPGKAALLTESQGIDPDELLETSDSILDPTAAVIEEVALEMPVYNLCRPDCPGLCPKCGKRKADGDCGCGNQKEIDPRLAIFKKILDNSKDV